MKPLIEKMFQGKWVVKKNRSVINSAVPALFIIDEFWHDGRFYLYYQYKGQGGLINLPKDDINNMEVVSEQDAIKLLKIFNDSGKLLNRNPNDLNNCCIRRDTGKPKVAFPENGFRKALFQLKLKLPEIECCAYKCPICGKIHLGTNTKEVEEKNKETV